MNEGHHKLEVLLNKDSKEILDGMDDIHHNTAIHLGLKLLANTSIYKQFLKNGNESSISGNVSTELLKSDVDSPSVDLTLSTIEPPPAPQLSNVSSIHRDPTIVDDGPGLQTTGQRNWEQTKF